MELNELNCLQRTVVALRGAVLLVAVGLALRFTWRATGADAIDLASALQTRRAGEDPLTVDEIVREIASVVLLTAVGVLTAVLVLDLTATLLSKRGGRFRAFATRLSPVLCRRVVAACCGVGIAAPGLAGSPALADDGQRHACQVSCSAPVAQLGGLRLPDLPTTAGARQVSDQVVVRRDDSLWSIAEQRLPTSATAADIQTLTRRLYALNRTVVGGDPDLIFPGTVLIAPEGTS